MEKHGQITVKSGMKKIMKIDLEIIYGLTAIDESYIEAAPCLFYVQGSKLAQCFKILNGILALYICHLL